MHTPPSSSSNKLSWSIHNFDLHDWTRPVVEPQKNQYAASSQSDQSQTALLSSSRSVQKNQYCSNAVSPLGNPLQQLQHGLTPDSLLQLCLHSAENQSTLQTAAVDGTHEPKNIFSQYDYVVILSDFWAMKKNISSVWNNRESKDHFVLLWEYVSLRIPCGNPPL
ncbi:hypothetical protein F2P81_007731 [Scophthalmus maximus]|uniref:Uncharacterized protein n=1 Tax=Scophthalmus maximus TaxID=52904 RepID=A0A6A4SW74_SCOMX|nr:hypothetical protein F2P81_007731 [Scophthalmus maximus]